MQRKILIPALLLGLLLAGYYYRHNHGGKATGSQRGKVTALSGVLTAGDHHLLALAANHRIYGWGDNQRGELGLAGVNSSEVPQQLTQDDSWVYLHTGNLATYAIDNEGSLWRRGFRESKDGSFDALFADYHWRKVVEHWGLTAGITSGGELQLWSEKAFGWASHAQLQNGSTARRFMVVPDRHVSSWRDVCVGHGIVVAVAADGSLWRSDKPADSFRNILDPASNDAAVPPVVGLSELAPGQRFQRVMCRDNAHQILAIDEQQHLWGYGSNKFGELGNGDGDRFKQMADIAPEKMQQLNDMSWIDIAPGHSVTYGITSDGRLWAWGRNGDGELGQGHSDWSSKPLLVDGQHQWRAVAAGMGFGVALSKEGQLYTWGRNAQVRGMAYNNIENSRPRPAAGNVTWFKE